MHEDDGVAARPPKKTHADSTPPQSGVRSQGLGNLAYRWPVERSPHAAAAEEAARKWVSEHRLAPSSLLASRFHEVGIGALTALTFPRASQDKLVLFTQFLAWIFIQDDRYDNAPPESQQPRRLQALFEGYLAVLGDPRAAAGSDDTTLALGDVAARLSDLASPVWMERFIQTMRRFWMDGVLVETVFRAQRLAPDPASYMATRVESLGGYPMLDLIEIANESELPANVVDDPIFRRIKWLTCRIMALANDIFSYEKERRVGDVNNYIHVLRSAESMTVAEAVDQTVRTHDRQVEQLTRLRGVLLPAMALEHAEQVGAYVDACQTWIAGALEWQKQSRRYASGRAYLSSDKVESIRCTG